MKLNTITTRDNYPSVFSRNLFDEFFSAFDVPQAINRSTQGYPVCDIYRKGDSTVMEFALAGFRREDLKVEILPEESTVSISADSQSSAENKRNIARRSFKKTFVNYDKNLDLANAEATFENGLLTIEVPNRVASAPIAIEIK